MNQQQMREQFKPTDLFISKGKTKPDKLLVWFDSTETGIIFMRWDAEKANFYPLTEMPFEAFRALVEADELRQIIFATQLIPGET